MATEAAGISGRQLDNQRQLQMRLETNRPSHGRTYLTESDEMAGRSLQRAAISPSRGAGSGFVHTAHADWSTSHRGGGIRLLWVPAPIPKASRSAGVIRFTEMSFWILI